MNQYESYWKKSDMRKILVSAYGCEPGKGSEPGVGWHWILEMAKLNQLWVITRKNNRSEIEKNLPSHLIKNLHFIYFDVPNYPGLLKRGDKGLYLYYFFWQWGAYLCAKKISKEIKFDFCMHLTFGSLWMPTFMHKLKIPFIWGPVGGGESVPFNYLNKLPWREYLMQRLRNLLIKCVALNPFFMTASAAAEIILVRTDDSKKIFPKKFQKKIITILETGVSQESLSESKLNPKNKSQCVEIIFSGRLIGIKNIEMAIEAFGLASRVYSSMRFTIIGDGPRMPSLKLSAKKAGVSDKVQFLGGVNQLTVLEHLKKSDIFLFPSLKEGGSWSLIEAIGAGCPVICMDISGMHVITDDSCAVRIRPTSYEDSVKHMADAIIKLSVSQELRQKMGILARERIKEHFTWPEKGVFMEKIFDKLNRN